MKLIAILRQPPPGSVSEPDRAALEAALLLKLQTGGSVTAVCLGSEAAVPALREAVSFGCDDALLIRTDRPGEERTGKESPGLNFSNPAFGAFVLAEALKSCGFDVILTSCKAADADAVQSGFLLAEQLHLPEAGFVTELSCGTESIGNGADGTGNIGNGADGTGSGAGRHLLVKRQFEDQTQRLMLPLPCLVSVLPQPKSSFYPTAEGITKAWSMAIPSCYAEDFTEDREKNLVPSVRLLSSVKIADDKKKADKTMLSLPGREAAAAVLSTLISHHMI